MEQRFFPSVEALEVAIARARQAFLRAALEAERIWHEPPLISSDDEEQHWSARNYYAGAYQVASALGVLGIETPTEWFTRMDLVPDVFEPLDEPRGGV